MISNPIITINKWKPREVNQWLLGLCDDTTWFNGDYVVNNGITGNHLLLITVNELSGLGANKVDLQEHILEAVDKLCHYSTNIGDETLQLAILRLACKSRSLHRQLVANRQRVSGEVQSEKAKQITLTRDFQNANSAKQRVELDTLACVSDISRTVRDITEVISRPPFSLHDDYRSIKSLILALSIELTSTAQRDQFVVRPNDIIEKSSKALADYCDRIVHGTKDVLLTQPMQIRTVRVSRSPHMNGLGFSIKSLLGCVHIIDAITPLSAAKKTEELVEGDEIIYLNQCIIGWSQRNVQRLLESSAQLGEVTLMVIKRPSDT